MRAIIPCAGFGTRMNMKPNESKEMLLDSDGQHLIDHILMLCNIYNLKPLIITRAEKIDLIEYCDKRGIETLIISPFGEWPDTILASESKWHTNNILILPDTRFEPTSIIAQLEQDLLNGARASIALHTITDATKWCVIQNYDIIEKPDLSLSSMAMGLIAFNKHEGYRLFKTISKRNNPYHLMDASFQYLTSFKDITRTGKIE